MTARHRGSDTRRPGRLAALLVALLAVVLLLALLPRKAARPTVRAADDEAKAPSVHALAPYASAPPPRVTPGPQPPVIDDISIEKTEVCEGEENLVTVKAHTQDGADDMLHFTIDGKTGFSVPVMLALDRNGHVAGRHFIAVFGRNNVSTIVPLPEYEVKPCRPRRAVALQVAVEANAPNTYDFAARVATLAAPPAGIEPVGPDRPFAPVAYDWSFGDGEIAHTEVPIITHSYERRPQDRLYTEVLASVEVRSRDGDKLVARRSLALLNPAFEDRAEKGIVTLQVSLEPRFPRLDGRGRVTQRVRLWHNDRQPVTIEGATKIAYALGGGGANTPEPVDVAGLLGTTAIPPGPDGITTEIVLDTVADPQIFSVNYALAGRSADGLPVMGTFSVMKPPPVPTAENSTPVTDPVLKAKILAAQKLLAKAVVNDDEIAMLERAGKFEGLESPDSSATVAAPRSPAQPIGRPR